MLGNLIEGGFKLIEGLMNRESAQENNKIAVANANADRAMQEWAMTHGVRTKAADARAAGLHPLFAMGASTHMPSATSLGLQNTGMGGALASMGQDIGRAFNATRNKGEREGAINAALTKLQLERGQLENDLLRTQIASQVAKNSPVNPPNPIGNRYLIDGQGDTARGSFEDRWAPVGSLVKDKPMERVPGAPGQLHQELAAITDVGFARTAGGGYAAVPSKDVKERIEDNIIQEVMHAVRNNIIPLFTGGNPPPVPADPGYSWRYDPYRFEYRQQRVRNWGPLKYRQWK